MAKLFGKQLRFGIVQPRTHQFHGIACYRGSDARYPESSANRPRGGASGIRNWSGRTILAALAAFEASDPPVHQMFPQMLIGKQIFRPIASVDRLRWS
ncbi:MAG: hypothetical protein R3F44_01525 [Candidatus Competibacteraceae bacterium]